MVLAEATRTNKILSFQRGDIHLDRDLESLQQEYRTAAPYPHLVLDNLFAPAMLDAVLGEMNEQSSRTWVEQNIAQLQKKSIRSAVDLGDRTFTFFSQLHSAAFLYLLTEMTGISGLLPDPYLTGAGPTIMPSGGKFDVHADRNTDHYSGLRRRLVMLLYLNKDWRPEYGGQLEIWDKAASGMEKSIEPVFNRAVFFEIGDQNFHAVRPVTPGSGRDRRSLTVYFHTVDLNVVLHNSIYAPKVFQSKEPFYRTAAREICPPVLHRMVRRLRAH